MRKLSKKIKLKKHDLLRSMVLILPLALIFSYHPVMTLGVGETMNFELSVSLIWLVVFDVIGMVAMVIERRVAMVWRWRKWLMFPVFATLSLIWSANLVRGTLTIVVMWLVVLAIMIMVVFLEELMVEEFRRKFLKWFFGTTVAVCVWCVVQCILDLAGVSREYSLMCLGCTSRTFGFPHPNGFAIEPQFMGNLLLAPALTAAWLYLRKDGRNGAFLVRLFCFFIVVVTLFLVFSRGAIYAFIVGLVFMSGWVMARERKRIGLVVKRLAVVWGVMVGAFVVALNLQGIMAEIGPTNDTYMDGVAKVINQLSLGVIDIRTKKSEGGDAAIEDNDVETGEILNDARVASKENSKEEAIFDGYVEESTEVRKMMTRNALKVWSRDTSTMILGVGIGGAGQAMYEMELTDTPKEIVQNEYASVLMETGLVGLVLVAVLAVMLVRVVIKSGDGGGAVLALMVAYSVSLVFFSGLANALQIYLLPVVVLFLFNKVSDKVL